MSWKPTKKDLENDYYIYMTKDELLKCFNNPKTHEVKLEKRQIKYWYILNENKNKLFATHYIVYEWNDELFLHTKKGIAPKQAWRYINNKCSSANNEVADERENEREDDAMENLASGFQRKLDLNEETDTDYDGSGLGEEGQVSDSGWNIPAYIPERDSPHVQVIVKLNEIQNYMKTEGYLKVKPQSEYRDGRIESMLGEEDIVNILTNKFAYVLANDGQRELGDVYIVHDGIQYPVNIKLYNSNKKSASNMFGLFRTYEYIFGIKAGGSLTKLAKQIAQHDLEHWMSVPLNNYYFLFINKNDYRDVRYGSILTMDHNCIVVNPKNGFQCRFDTVAFEELLDKKKAVSMLLNKFETYIKKLAEPYLMYESLKKT